MAINGDGVLNPDGKVFNQTYPGPWLKACWGDTIKVTIKNSLKYNGTTIHWHGIRQNGTMEMDGVNGVTQCPIAPQDNYTYVPFKLLLLPLSGIISTLPRVSTPDASIDASNEPSLQVKLLTPIVIGIPSKQCSMVPRGITLTTLCSTQTV